MILAHSGGMDEIGAGLFVVMMLGGFAYAWRVLGRSEQRWEDEDGSAHDRGSALRAVGSPDDPDVRTRAR